MNNVTMSSISLDYSGDSTIQKHSPSRGSNEGKVGKSRNSPANANPLKCTLRMRIGKLRQLQIDGNASNVTVNKVDLRQLTTDYRLPQKNHI